MAKGTSIAVFGAKGGTGKTIFTLNLAGAIAKLGKTCLIVDADLYSGQIDCALNKKLKRIFIILLTIIVIIDIRILKIMLLFIIKIFLLLELLQILEGLIRLTQSI